MARIRTWADFRSAVASDARQNRTAFVMIAWSGLLSIPMLIGAAVMLFGVHQQWLGNTLAVLIVLYMPAGLYFKIRHRPNRAVKRRPYRRESVAGHRGAEGLLRPQSWRWAVVAATVAVSGSWVALACALIQAAPSRFVWQLGIALLASFAVLLLAAVATHPVADRAAVRLQASMELEYPNATFAIFKSSQVCSQIACADPTSRVTAWNDSTFRAVVTFDVEGVRVWDQSWGNRVNAATIPWSRVQSLEPAVARVRWRFIRGIDLRLISLPGEPEVGVVLPPVKSQRHCRPVADEAYRALFAQLDEHLQREHGSKVWTVKAGE
jgi:multisubunit Na+/H+ antiporter MnhG subunit